MAFLTQEEQDAVALAIENAEMRADGEIRVAIINSLKKDVMTDALTHFKGMGMHKTLRKNGVLIFIAQHDRQFAILGDTGIDKKVPEHFWEETKNAMHKHLAQGKLYDAITMGVYMAGEQLAKFFPRKDFEVNELPNEVVFLDKLKNDK